MHELSLKLQEFFFEAALATYAGSTPKTSIDGLPKSKVYRYERNNYLYIDTYFTNSEQSGGQTIIYIKSFTSPVVIHGVNVQDPCWVPAWIMQYHGWCEGDDKKVLDFLKKVLSQSYSSRTFCGGRGVATSELNPTDTFALQYKNKWLGTFDHFSGEEKIIADILPDGRINREEKEVFWHRYQGMTLLQEVQQEN